MKFQRRRASGPPGCKSGGIPTKSRLFQSKVVVRRAPLLTGLSCGSNTLKKFQRPMVKRRSYKNGADAALKQSSLGQRKRMDGMSKLLARAGRPLHFLPKHMQAKNASENSDTEESSDSENESEARPFEPLRLWKSPFDETEDDEEDVPLMGIPPTAQTVTRTDPDTGIDEEVTVLQPAPKEAYSRQSVYCPPALAKWLRPHQREGVQFLYRCVMGLHNYNGRGCILADDMGLGKTLSSVTLIYTLLKTSLTHDKTPTAKRVIVVCPCSLVKNWENEFVKWLGPGVVKTLALAQADRQTVIRNLDSFCKTRLFQILICSYECLRTHHKRMLKYPDCCDLLVCDEAHRLKNSDNQTSKALDALPVKRRVLLTGTPMQNDLLEFYSMVDFCNPGLLGTPESFKRKFLYPILRGREPDATERQQNKMRELQNDLSMVVNDFILRRVNTLNAQHLPPKLVQVVCCQLTDLQKDMYNHLVHSKDVQHVLDGKQSNCLGSIQMLMKLSNHPSLVVNDDSAGPSRGGGRSSMKKLNYSEDPTTAAAAPGASGLARFLPQLPSRNAPVMPEWSGKMFVLCRLMKEMRTQNDKIVIVSNYTQTLDLIGRMCQENSWGFCRLDGSIAMKKRQEMCDSFNDPHNQSLVAFLLSSKAGGCGLNLIGANRLVLFEPDWNPAVDKQAAARCWRDGQTKRCFTYRFLATGTIEEKIFQRQLSKEGLQSVVDDKEQTNHLSTKDLKNLFKLRSGTPSDTHDKLRCERCKIIQDNAEAFAQQVLPRKLTACKELLVNSIATHPSAHFFAAPLVPADHGRTQEEYEGLVKQPIDFGTITKKLEDRTYTSVSGFSKDVNRVFTNVLKVWSTGDAIADAAHELQTVWMQEWTGLVPRLMAMKADEEETEGKAEEVCAAATTSGNERGEDYQEQIGMPDEENMRHWSHHYSADTVDDPVFRAAMRGYDTVSFVFGLEVTWSLIQQRQQDEEERLAMEEMESCKVPDCEVAPKEDSINSANGAVHADDSDSGDSSEDDEPPMKKIKPASENAVLEDSSDSDSETPNEPDADGPDSDDSSADDKAPVKKIKPAAETMVLEESSDSDSDMLDEPKAKLTKPAPAGKRKFDVSDNDSSESDGGEIKLKHEPIKTKQNILDDSSEEEDAHHTTSPPVGKEPKAEKRAPFFSDDSDEDVFSAPAKPRKASTLHFDSSSDEETPVKKPIVPAFANKSLLDESSDDELELLSSKPTFKAQEPILPETGGKENATSQVSSACDEWECQVCTLLNRKSARSCVACESKKPRAA